MTRRNTFQQIRELAWEHQVVLALYLCERMLPNYQLFHHLTGFGDPKPLQSALNACWDWIAAPRACKVNFSRWQEKVDDVTPSEHGHDMLGVYPAMDACTALSTLLQGLMDNNANALVDVAKVSQASVAKFIELTEGEHIDAEQLPQLLREHELTQYEIDIQLAIIDFLASQPQISQPVVSMVRQMVTDEGVSNVGLALDAEE
ncbi:DUF416 domain-containing protein [Idiomarina tyrosinivorans]|uniref:DUF416 domain-containing protein n=1 Tax=Idiomarina tyrosinivorans TaxID=1445662 RepID=A0A432ZT76_9GAMM|nr:YjaG family protein [Idiomarina tyrosinivorans]RUO81120.1 DUF416 domain-containing protein [Idiomarina tyrosinivorans]